jgi:hypothetical protein
VISSGCDLLREHFFGRPSLSPARCHPRSHLVEWVNTGSAADWTKALLR